MGRHRRGGPTHRDGPDVYSTFTWTRVAPESTDGRGVVTEVFDVGVSSCTVTEEGRDLGWVTQVTHL